MALLIQCNQCGASVTTENGLDPDGELVCRCCPEDHHHGEAANACPGIEDAEHICGVDNPDCTVCRPISITLLAGSGQVSPVVIRA
jgi:hypothetical protein